MRKLIPALVILFCLPSLLFAQESVGFSDPDNIQPLLDYRLPEWGYTNFYLDFSLDGNTDRTYLKQAEHISTENEFAIQLSPVYYRLYSSESHKSSYSFQSEMDYFSNKSNDFGNNKESATNYNLELGFHLDEKFFLKDSDLFLTGQGNASFDQVKTEEGVNPNNNFLDRWEFVRNFETFLAIGVGYGRLRTVNPVIRSLRLGERLNTLNSGRYMSNEDYISAAEQFSKFNGYQDVYDRPQKYFWEDMDEMISPNLSDLNPFDLLYLTDTTLETIGSRREGWEIQALVAFDYSARYAEDESLGNGSDMHTETYLRPSLSGSWSKNFSLKHQIGLSANIQSFIHLESENSAINLITLSSSWLYTVTDRILSTTSIFFLGRMSDSWDGGSLFSNTEVDYFIENRFSLFANAGLVHYPKILDPYHEQRSIRFTFSAGLRYYFKRELF